MNRRRLQITLFALLFIGLALIARRVFADGPAIPNDVLDERQNLAVTKLTEDCESVRMALGAAWADALACRSYSGYLRPWATDDSHDAAEKLANDGVAMYERVKCIDDGIQHVRFSRDAGDVEHLQRDLDFWRNELALAATSVSAYVDEAAALEAKIKQQLIDAGDQHQVAAKTIDPIPWENPDREAWRRAGPKVGIRLPINPDPDSPAAHWNAQLGLAPGYIASKMRSAGDEFVSSEQSIGAWGYNCTAPGAFDFKAFNDEICLVNERNLKYLLELPTLGTMTPSQLAAQKNAMSSGSWWIWDRYAPPLPAHLANDPAYSLQAPSDDGSTRPMGGVNLFSEPAAKAYGEYLNAMADDLKREGLYDTIAAIHLEKGDATLLPEEVDYSDITRARWQAFMKDRYHGELAALNKAAGLALQNWESLPIPPRVVDPKAATDFAKYLSSTTQPSSGGWGNYIHTKYPDDDQARAALGDDYREGYGFRLPYGNASVIGIDYMQFRRQWVRDYLAIKHKLMAAAFPDKLLITEMRQMGDHDEIAQTPERKWGGFNGDDFAVWSGTGPHNEAQPFMIRSVGPPGFGTRPSDSLESLFRDYLWINFRDPGNMARYFYAWVSHGYLDYQLGWHSITNHWRTNRLVYRLGPTVANTEPAPQSIGMVMPRTTLDLGSRSIYDGFLGWNWMLYAAKLPYTRVDEWRIRNGELPGLNLEILILPDVRAMDVKVAEEIAKWVSAGGTLVCSRVPGETDEYGRPLEKSPLADVLGASVAGTTQEGIADTPLTRTISHGVWPDYRAPRPDYQVLRLQGAQALASYISGGTAISSKVQGMGRAIVFGYEFGRECVIADRTSVAFGRIYTTATRESQLVERIKWIRDFFVNQLGYKPEFSVEYADVARWKEKEHHAMGLSVLKGFSQDPNDFFYVRTLGDPRPDHEVEIEHETPDMAIRFFPRERSGVATKYIGISTREVHYIAPRGLVNMHLSPHTYRCRINNPKIAAMWDVERNVPVGFTRDDAGVSFDISLPSGYIMMLAVSETPEVQVFAPAAPPGRTDDDVIAACKALMAKVDAPAVSILTLEGIRPWLEHLAKPIEKKITYTDAGQKEKVLISYGQPGNKPAAEKLAAHLRDTMAIDAEAIEQAGVVERKGLDQAATKFDQPLIFIGDEWTNNDFALHTSFWNWGNHYGAHLPFTATYLWPGSGRAVVSLSSPFALINEAGRQVEGGNWNNSFQIRPVEDRFPIVRQKLYIAGNGDDAMHAVEAIIALK